MQGRQGRTVPESPRPVHGPWHGLLVSKLIGHMHEASSNVEQTRYPVMTRHVFIPLKIAWIPTKPVLSQWVSNQMMANGLCFTVVSVIAECWHIKLRHVRWVWFDKNRSEFAEWTAHWTPMVPPRYKTRLFHGRWCDTVRVHKGIRICAVPCGMCSTHRQLSH